MGNSIQSSGVCEGGCWMKSPYSTACIFQSFFSGILFFILGTGALAQSDCIPQLDVICPDAIVLPCTDYDGESTDTGSPSWELNDCENFQGDFLEIMIDDVLLSNNSCSSVYARTFTVFFGNATGSCTQLITVMDNVGPVFDDVPADIQTECSGELPSPAELTAADACGEVVEIQTFVSSNQFGSGSEQTVCQLTTPIGPGPDGSVWLSLVANMGLAASDFWSWIGNPVFTSFPDGTAHLTGSVVNNADASQGWNVDMWFEARADWLTWSGLG
ncbi:MAG: hypothetical protein IT223_09180, partial [Crocinitomicaceae bacterium]|nr:hypothetical protein [Crocinitomicaceae bacterium]